MSDDQKINLAKELAKNDKLWSLMFNYKGEDEDQMVMPVYPCMVEQD